MLRRTFRRAFASLLLAVPALALSGCDASKEGHCEDRSSTYDETFFVDNLRRADGTKPPPDTSCEELCFLAAGYEQVPCRIDYAGTPNALVTCTANFICEE
jgi:hypothetical protein